MTFTVVWTTSARDKLANYWLAAVDKQAITDAANKIDQCLRSDPENQGYQVDNYRTMKIAPLIILFRVSLDDCLVTVTDIHHL